MGCPMASDNGKADFLRYPKMLAAYIKATQRYLDTHQHTGAFRKFGNAYNIAYHNIFTKSYEQYLDRVTGGLFPENAIDTKKYIEDYFGLSIKTNPNRVC